MSFLAPFHFAWHLIKVVGCLKSHTRADVPDNKESNDNKLEVHVTCTVETEIYPEGGAQQFACAEGQAEH